MWERGDEETPILEHPLTTGLRAHIIRAVKYVRELQGKLNDERSLATVQQDLGDALDVADSENEIIAIAARAADQAMPSSGFQLLLADHASSALLPCCDETPQLC